jgi:hypothetical protein
MRRRNHKVNSPRARAAKAAAQVTPLARTTATAASRSVRATRTWAAPQLERTAKVIQASIAPKISAALSSAAHRLEPGTPRPSGWRRKLAGATVLTGAASAAAAAVLNRRKPTTSSAEAEPDDVTPAAQTSDGQAGRSADTEADVNGRVRTS